MMQLTNLRAKIERSLSFLSFDDLAQVSAFIDSLTNRLNVKVRQNQPRSNRLQWVQQLRENRLRFSGPSDRQTVLEMRAEERY